MSTGPTGTADIDPLIREMFPNVATGPVEPPHIATLDELMASREATIAQEAVDRATLSPLLNPSRDQFRPQLFQWAEAGFPDGYVVQRMQLNPPRLCSDGVVRTLQAYTWYLVETEMADLLANLNALMIGISTSYSFEGNSLLLHVGKS
jgi:hypothetical protein